MRVIQALVCCLLLVSAMPQAFAHQTRFPIGDVSGCSVHLLENPLYTYVSGPFPYDQLNAEHFEPYFDEALAIAKKRIAGIIKDSSKPTFKNTIVPMEMAPEAMNHTLELLSALANISATDALREVAVKIHSKYEAFQTDMSTNLKLKARVDAVVARGARNKLTEQEKTLLKIAKNSFVAVADDKVARLKFLDEEIVKLGDQFKANVSAETAAYELVIIDENDLRGIPEENRKAAVLEASKRKKAGSWIFTLSPSSVGPFLQFSEIRELREKIWRAWTSMGSRPPFDNRDIILKIVAFRQERADLLGHDNHAEYQLHGRMAKNVETVNQFLNQLGDAFRGKAEEELAELEQFAGHKIENWDVAFYSEKLKQQKFALNANDLKPYFVFDNVLKGAMYAANRLFGVDFVARNLPTWNRDVRAFEVFDRQGEHLGYYYFDPFPRPGQKRAGAFSTELIPGGYYEGRLTRPSIVNVGNLTPPTAEGEPALLTLNDVRTVFHEMGHGLHQLLSKAHYRSLFGTNVVWDFVELPSQLFEKWALVPEVLDVYARHYQTGERIPQTLIDKVKASANFGAGLFELSMVFKSKLDIDWYSVPVNGRSVEEFEADVRAKYSILPANGALTSTSFSHIFPNSYSAGYYSYRWADVTVADAHEMFEENGMFDPRTAFLYHSQVLEPGGSEDPDLLYPRFRGRPVDPNAYFRRHGLSPKTTEPKQLELFQ